MSIIIKDSIFSCSMISEKYILVNYSSEKSDIYSISGELVLNNIWTGKIKNIQSQKLDDNDIAILIGNSKLFLFSSDNKKMYEYLATDKYIKKIICYKKYIALLLWPKEKFSNFGLYDYQEVMVFSKDLKVIFYKRFYGWLHIGRSFLRNYCNFDFENEEFRLFNFHAVFHYRLIP